MRRSSPVGNKWFLGISANGFDSACALVKGTRIVAAVEEERFTRRKHDGSFPENAVAYCLKYAGIAPRDLGSVAISWNYDKYEVSDGDSPMLRFLERQRQMGLEPDDLEAQRYRERFDRSAVLEACRRILVGAPDPKFLEHHECHAASAHFCSGFDEAIVIVIDGSGEEHSLSIFRGVRGSLQLLERLDVPDSLGHFYQAMTEYAGFSPRQDEGAFMALAGIVTPGSDLTALMRRCVRPEGGLYRIDSNLVAKRTLRRPRDVYGGDVFTDEFARQASTAGVPPKCLLAGQDGFRLAASLASACQISLEETVLHVARSVMQKTGIRRLCLAGGVALNCKLNGRLLEELTAQSLLDAFFVQPASHDAGAALGAAYVECTAHGAIPTRQICSMALGPAFSRDEVVRSLEQYNLNAEPLSMKWENLAEALARGAVCAVLSGRMEFGPRALGQRSLLASAESREMVARLNEIKRRQPFRPCAPSFLATGSFQIPNLSVYVPRFMICSYRAQPHERHRFPGAVHVDGSFRPQLARRGDATFLSRLLVTIESKGRAPVLLNTSFNVQAPIVCSLNEAIETFLQNDIDLLVLNDMVVSKCRGCVR